MLSVITQCSYRSNVPTLSFFWLPSNALHDRTKQFADEGQEVLMEIRVLEKNGKHSKVPAQVLPDGVVGFILKSICQFQDVDA